jgi:hypothetical protein
MPAQIFCMAVLKPWRFERALRAVWNRARARAPFGARLMRPAAAR